MKKIIKKGAKIERFTKSREEAIAYFKEKNEPYKVELVEDLPEGEEISFYSQGDWTDLCAGPHLMSVKPVKAFKLLFFFQCLLERKRKERNADTYLRNSICYKR